MKSNIKKEVILSCIVLVLGLFFVKNANAATLSSVSDTVTTSRPSSAAPLNADQAAAAAQVSVVDNGAQYLASDSAVIYKDTGETTNAGLNIASMSGQIAGSPLTRNVYFTGTITNTHHKGDVLIVNVTATHTVKFTPISTIPNGGKIVITFPGAGSNSASPSATGFSFNGMSTSAPSDVLCFPTTACNGASIAVSGSNTITLTTGASISGGTGVFVLIGCTTQSSGTCTAFASRLINPTKAVSNTCTNLGVGSPCTADQWKVNIKTQDASSIDLDSGKAVVAAIEAVQVQGTVDAYITFTITGLDTGTSACSDTTNPGGGLGATATFVNLGNLTSGGINISAQNLIVSTNGSAGYAISATSSGRFINPASGFFISDANGGNGLTNIDIPAPGFLTSGTPAFGIHPCAAGSTSVPTVPGIWGTGATGGGAGAKYSNPWNTGVNGFYANISSFPSPASSSTTTVEYASTISNTTPAGTYSNIFTYVATPIF